MVEPLFLGLDFGTESVRALVVDREGRERASAVAPFEHGQIVPGTTAAARLFGTPLPPNVALQHPQDWIESAAQAVQEAGRSVDRHAIAGIGVDFTSCTMLPCDEDGQPLMVADDLVPEPHAWPKLWKHHGAVEQTARMNRIARQRNEPWLARYGGVIGLEWFFPKIFEVIERAPHVAERAAIWIEAGDWFVWRLVGGDAHTLPRSTCQAGYKALWSRRDGYPPAEYLAACHPALAESLERKMPGRRIAPGETAGGLNAEMARRLGLIEGTPVSAAIIDAHAGVPGAGVAENAVLVMVLGTSGCHMLMSDREALVPGVAGVVEDGILPGHFGYETGQAAMGDAFDWMRRISGGSFEELDEAARGIAPGSDGVVAVDWFNGCRTPLMDGSLGAGFAGLTLHHTPGHLYRAVIEASAMGLRWIVETLRRGDTPSLREGSPTNHAERGGARGIPVDRFVATGGLPHHNPLFIEIIASALGAPVEIHGCRHGPALGAAILGACAAEVFDSPAEAVHAMAGPESAQPPSTIVVPECDAVRQYDRLYARYRALADHLHAFTHDQ